MDATWRIILWRQFGAAIDMLDNALLACPDELWRIRLWRDGAHEAKFSEFWNVVYHALFWLDLYLSGSVEGFAPPAPFGLEELDPAGLPPDRPYTKDELRAYLDHGRQQCRATIEGLTDQRLRQVYTFSWGEVTCGELLHYNMRHVQEHAAQLNLILGQKVGEAPRWVTRTRTGIGAE